MRPPPIQWIPVFEATGRFSSFRKAADLLNVSPSAVSQQIKALEEYLGVALFRRSGPRVDLTEAGEFYYPHAQKVLAAHVAGFNEFDRQFNQHCLKLSTPLFVAQEMLIPNYMAFKDIEPKADLRITTGTDYIDFESGAADAAIRFGDGDWPHLHARLLCPVKFAPVCAPGYFDANTDCRNTRLDELLRGRVLITTGASTQEWQALFPASDTQDYIVCDSYFAAVKSAEKGLGVAMGIFPAVNAWVKDGRLAVLGEGLMDSPYGYWLVSPKSSRVTPLLDSCYEWALGLFEGLPGLGE